MDFNEAFEKLLGHEGGYADDRRENWIKYVNEYKERSRSRIASDLIGCVAARSTCSHSIGFRDLRQAQVLKKLQMQSGVLRAPSLRQGFMQRALHPRAQGAIFDGATKGAQARRFVRGVRGNHWDKRRMGALSAPLQPGSIRNTERCSSQGLWLQVRALCRPVPPRSFRLSPQGRQARISERYVRSKVDRNNFTRAVEVHFALRQLPQNGAPR